MVKPRDSVPDVLVVDQDLSKLNLIMIKYFYPKDKTTTYAQDILNDLT